MAGQLSLPAAKTREHKRIQQPLLLLLLLYAFVTDSLKFWKSQFQLDLSKLASHDQLVRSIPLIRFCFSCLHPDQVPGATSDNAVNYGITGPLILVGLQRGERKQKNNLAFVK